MLNYEYGEDDKIVNIHSKKNYGEMKAFVERKKLILEVKIETKYKTTTKKNAIAMSLFIDYEEKFKKLIQSNLKDPKKIGHEFIDSNLNGLKVGEKGFWTNIERQHFEEIFLNYDKAFVFESHDIRYVDLSVVIPMMIFTISHVP